VTDYVCCFACDLAAIAFCDCSFRIFIFQYMRHSISYVKKRKYLFYLHFL